MMRDSVDLRKRSQVNAFSSLKAKLAAGNNVVIFVNGDSTSHSKYGVYYKFVTMLGDLYNCTVNAYRWAEYDDVAGTPTGPKDYAAADALRSGTAQTITLYLASFPGRVAGTMFDGSRKPTAIDAIPTPDMCIMHHGHNMQSYPMITPNTIGDYQYSNGVGKWLGPIGMQEIQWPNVPQVLVTQNPWQSDNGFEKCYNAMRLVARMHKELTVVDTYMQFIARGKLTTLYRGGDNIHPSDSLANSAGAQLQADTLIDAYKRAKSTSGFITPAWPSNAAKNLIDNGDFSNWPSTLPVGWTAVGAGLSVTKETTIKYGAAAYSCKIAPSTSISGQSSYMQKYLSGTEMAAIAGKTVCFSALCYSANPAANPAPYFSIYNKFGNLRDYVSGALMDCQNGWMWYISGNIPVTQNAAEVWRYMRFTPAQTVPNPTTSDPMYVQRVLVTEGLPAYGLIAP